MASSEKSVHEGGEEASDESDKEEEEWSNKSWERSQLHNSFHFSPNKEKQISVDPMSLKQPPPVLPPLVKPKFVSASLPCSATSSPDFSSSLPNSLKKWRDPAHLPHPAFHPSLARQHSVMQSQHPQHQNGMFLLRSKSCGDGRSSQPSDEFDILSRHGKFIGQHQTGVLASESSSKDREEMYAPQRKEEEEEEFKCGALCLFLPGLAKKKQEVRLQRQASREMKDEEQGDDDEDGGDEENEENSSVVSRGASLEKFECSSWSCAALVDDTEDDFDGGISSYFELPLELIRGSCDDAHSPIKTAFVFDRERKGVLKNTSKSGARKSHEASNRHVRFSTSAVSSYPPSSPSSGCVTPKFFQAREEFNSALLEAQNAYINF